MRNRRMLLIIILIIIAPISVSYYIIMYFDLPTFKVLYVDQTADAPAPSQSVYYVDKLKIIQAQKYMMIQTKKLLGTEVEKEKIEKLQLKIIKLKKSCLWQVQEYNKNARKLNRSVLKNLRLPLTLNAIECDD